MARDGKRTFCVSMAGESCPSMSLNVRSITRTVTGWPSLNKAIDWQQCDGTLLRLLPRALARQASSTTHKTTALRSMNSLSPPPFFKRYIWTQLVHYSNTIPGRFNHSTSADSELYLNHTCQWHHCNLPPKTTSTSQYRPTTGNSLNPPFPS